MLVFEGEHLIQTGIVSNLGGLHVVGYWNLF